MEMLNIYDEKREHLGVESREMYIAMLLGIKLFIVGCMIKKEMSFFK